MNKEIINKRTFVGLNEIAVDSETATQELSKLAKIIKSMSLHDTASFVDSYDICNTLCSCLTSTLSLILESKPVSESARVLKSELAASKVTKKEGTTLLRSVLKAKYTSLEFLRGLALLLCRFFQDSY